MHREVGKRAGRGRASRACNVAVAYAANDVKNAADLGAVARLVLAAAQAVTAGSVSGALWSCHVGILEDSCPHKQPILFIFAPVQAAAVARRRPDVPIEEFT